MDELKCIIENDVVLNSIPSICNITNKGGQRLINFIRLIMSSKKDTVAVYNPAAISYLVNTKPQNLYNFSTSSRNQIIDQLMDDKVYEYEVVDGALIPVKFKDSNAIFNWIMTKDPAVCVNLFNEIKKAKDDHEDLIEHDLLEFDEFVPEAESLSKKYMINKHDIIKAFIEYSV